jgi:hypothetical protein
VYLVIALPPLFGAVQLTFADLLPAVADTPVGAPGGVAAVVKLQENGLLIGVPEAFCAPDTVAVYLVLPASKLTGVNVATVSAALKPNVPTTPFPAESFTVNDTVLGTTACENVADGATDTATPVAPELGVTPVTDGGGAGVTAADGDDASPVPTALVADTVNV